MKMTYEFGDISCYITSYKFVQEILIVWKLFGFEPFSNWSWLGIFSPSWMLFSFIAIAFFIECTITFLKRFIKND